MQSKVSIIVVGDPGPVRHELLLRSDLQTLWVNRAEEMLAILRDNEPSICLIAPDTTVIEAHLMLDIAAARGRLACVLLVDAGAAIEPRLAARAAAIVPQERVESILALVGLHTGLTFAREPRANIEARAHVYIGDDEFILETANIGVSGCAIRHFPKVPLDTMVHLELDVHGATVLAEARVVRYGVDQNIPIAGLSFVRISRAQRERLELAVDRARRDAERPHVRITDLFGDLTLDLGRSDALSTADLSAAAEQAAPDLITDHELALARRIIQSGEAPPETPDWLLTVIEELTALERYAALAAPDDVLHDWALPAMRMRICLARSRTLAKLPSLVADAGYRMFVNLAEVLTKQTEDDVITQIAQIRATLLRDLLAQGPRPRSGAGPTRADQESIATKDLSATRNVFTTA